jgi:hypothetical protein
LGFLPRFGGGGFGGFTMSEDGGFEEFDELRSAFASFASSSAMRASSRSMMA